MLCLSVVLAVFHASCSRALSFGRVYSHCPVRHSRRRTDNWSFHQCTELPGVLVKVCRFFSIKKTLNSQRNLKNFLFKVLTIGFYTFCLSFRQIMDTIPKKLFLFQGKPFDEPFFDFFIIGEALLCE